MLKRAFMTVGIAAVLLTGIFPAGDGCGIEAWIDHACCAEMQAEAVSSCCSGTEADIPSSQTSQTLDCTCVHPPSATIATAVSCHSGQDGDSPSHLVQASAPHLHWVHGLQRPVERRAPSHPPPPVFLLDCSFLI